MSQSPNMDAAALTLLVEILDSKSLSEAARNLKVTRANVSYRLAQLEKAAGQQLVRRTTRKIEPTEIGLRLYGHGKAIRQQLAAAREAVDNLGSSLRGRIRLSVPSGFGQLVMTDWLLDFKTRYPDVVLALLFENRVDDLLQEGVDVAVRVMSHPPLSTVARELGGVRYVACASPEFLRNFGQPDSPESLQILPVITSLAVGRELCMSAVCGDEHLQIELEPTLTSENFDFLRQAVLAGIGIGLVPDYVVARDIAAGLLKPLLSRWRLSLFGTRMFLLRMPNSYPTVAVRTLIDFVLERAKESAVFHPREAAL
jgi:DNA-binding transcriptional LysR family regulator